MTKPTEEQESTNPIKTYFQFDQLQTNFKRETVAGFTTFITMAYILIANPDILSNAIFLEEAGDLFDELAIATAISAAIATFVMGIYARFPFALAPGMGLNAYFAFSVVLTSGIRRAFTGNFSNCFNRLDRGSCSLAHRYSWCS